MDEPMFKVGFKINEELMYAVETPALCAVKERLYIIEAWCRAIIFNELHFHIEKGNDGTEIHRLMYGEKQLGPALEIKLHLSTDLGFDKPKVDTSYTYKEIPQE